MRQLIEALYPICRSITGPGVRATLDLIGQQIDLDRPKLPTGTRIHDWTVPQEWELTGAYLSHAGDDTRIVDAAESNLHVVNFSTSVDAVMSLEELRPHLHTLPDRPDCVPYRTSYYHPAWGLCLTDNQLNGLAEGDYRVRIDTHHRDGFLEWGECTIEGSTRETVLLTTHICHPSLANDNLSGIAVLTALAKFIASAPRRLTYKLLFIPGTIGSIGWLATNPEAAAAVTAGLVITGLGDTSDFTYKRSQQGDATIDRVLEVLLRDRGQGQLIDFTPYGYDERQFCSPGYNMGVGRLTRGVHGEYPEYHTSADNLGFIQDEALAESLELLTEVVESLESNRRYVNLAPYGEPQLGKRGIYSSVGGAIDQKSVEMGYLWVLNQSDGLTDLCAIASRSGLAYSAVATAADRLKDHDLLGDPK
ncbi:MAG TPA: peptidase M28 [Acidimicrobiaceae bacterium]|nr:peptidase M28 [Acidimicrobiaceae bacterium]